MNQTLLPKLKELYNKFQQTEDYKNRKEQFKVVEVNKSIIKETLTQGSLTNEFLSGFIQMFKYGCSDQTFDKYLAQNIKDEDKRNELSRRAYQANEWGYTGAGLNSIFGLTDGQLEIIQLFLIEAFKIDTIIKARELCKAFDENKIPLVTMGIYSPWLYYINPELFPILNNSHNDFKKWINTSSDYPSAIKDFHTLKLEVGETDLGLIDMFAHDFKKYNSSETLETLELKGHKLFKISHGIFTKHKDYRNTGFKDVLVNNNWICLNIYTGKGQASKFITEAKVGDFVYVSYGGDNLVYIAEIISDSQPLDDEDDELLGGDGEWVFRQVKPLYFPKDKSLKDLKDDTRFFMPSGNSTFYEVPSDLTDINKKLFIPKFNIEIKNIGTTDQDTDLIIIKMEYQPLNQILYGPPGTGKTYKSIDKAVKIATGSSGEHKANKIVFDQLRAEGQIEFVTFHQGYSYEDFMVGIKPNTDTEQLTFKPYKGIFYRLVELAKENYLASKDQRSVSKSFDQVFQDLLIPLENDEDVEIKMASGSSFKIREVENGTIRFTKPNGSETHTLSVETLRAIVDGKREFNSGLGVYYKPLVKLLKENQITHEPKATLKNYVIIIDEINRANISKVFGELITLLEDDKRIDADNALSVTLPNGELNFSIPPNLYIVGTMNTADKSISLIDVALRRRFEFEGFYPDYKVLQENYSERIELLKLLNNAIYTKKKTADYLIGHGYFMKEESTEDILLKKIIPLLMEYFSGRIEEVASILKSAGYDAQYNDTYYKWELNGLTPTVDETSIA